MLPFDVNHCGNQTALEAAWSTYSEGSMAGACTLPEQPRPAKSWIRCTRKDGSKVLGYIAHAHTFG